MVYYFINHKKINYFTRNEVLCMEKEKFDLLIFEGIDGSGKTTLMNNFKKELENGNTEYEYFPTFVTSDEIPHVREFLSTNLNIDSDIRRLILRSLFVAGEINLCDEHGFFYEKTKDHNPSKTLILMDRFFPSLIYNVGMDEYKVLEKIIVDKLQKFCNVYCVYCYCDPSVAMKRIQSRNNTVKDYFETEDRLRYALIRFNILFGDEFPERPFNFIEIDTGYYDEKKSVEILKTELAYLTKKKGE